MSISNYANGSQTTVLATEHFVSSPNVNGRFQMWLDLSPMVALDILEVRAYKIAKSGGTSRLIWFTAYYGVQNALVVPTPEILNDLFDTNSIRFSIKQTAGTVHAYDWNVIRDVVDVSYQAKIWLADDNTNTTDHYMVSWFKDGAALVGASTGITSPTIQVIKASDGSDLIGSTAMTAVSTTGFFRYDATSTARIADGVAYIVQCTATIDGAVRYWSQPMSRDS